MKDWLLIFLAAFIFMVTIDGHSQETMAAPDDAQAAVCKEQLKDEIYIVRLATELGMTFHHMRQKAINSHGELGDERFEKINSLIDKAENAAHEDKLIEWLNELWDKCLHVI